MLIPIHEKLAQKEVLNRERVLEIKREIHVRHQSLLPQEKARILAKAIHQILDESIPDFSKETKTKIRMALLQQHLDANSLTINGEDIVTSCIACVSGEELEKELPQWISRKVEVELEKVERYIRNLQEVAVTGEMNIDRKGVKLQPILLGLLGLLVAGSFAVIQLLPEKTVEEPLLQETEQKTAEVPARSFNDLPRHLQYQSIKKSSLREWLQGRNSILADEPYFSTILQVADEFNIHPYLLFAITGQEQGFVPKDHEEAEKIANNPFNVYHSWEEFNTTILDSTEIAARTIVNLSKERPEEADPIQWINRKYAEDPNWWKGVSSIFQQLEREV